MVHTFINAALRKVSVITGSMAVSTARALMKLYPDIVSNTDIQRSHRTQSLSPRMGVKRRKSTTSKHNIPEGARKETEMMFIHFILEKVEEYSIPHSIIPSFNQTWSKFIPSSNKTLLIKTVSRFVLLVTQTNS